MMILKNCKARDLKSMPKASVKRIINCKKNELIELVLDIEQYPKFIPYCIDSKVYQRDNKENEILISFMDNSSPIIAQEKSNPDLIYVLMPMRV